MSPALLAVGKSMYGALGFLFTTLTIVIGLPLAYSRYEMVGAMIVIPFYDLPLYGVTMYGLWREGFFCLAQDIKTTAIFLGLLTGVLLSRYYLLGLGLPISQILR
jgi:hypothetical protein